MEQKTIGLTREDQQEAWENAKDRILEETDVDDPTAGEILRVLADSYTGNYDEEPLEAVRNGQQ